MHILVWTTLNLTWTQAEMHMCSQVIHFIYSHLKNLHKMALKATWSFSRKDTTGKADELLARGDKGVCPEGHRHFYTVSGPKEELQLYIDTVKTATFNPVSDDGSVIFSTLYPSITDECTLYRSRKVNPKTGTYNYGLDESGFTRLTGQLDRVKNEKIQDILINAKAYSVMGLKPSATAVQAMNSIDIDSVDDDTDDDTEAPKPKAKAKVNPESEAE